MRKFRRMNSKKERTIMIISSAFVLVALTLTGIFMRNQSAEIEDDGYSVDFSVLENKEEPEESRSEGQAEDAVEKAGIFGQRNEIPIIQDHDPIEQTEEAGSSQVKIPGLTDRDTTGGKRTTDDRNLGSTGTGNNTSITDGNNIETDAEVNTGKKAELNAEAEHLSANAELDDESNTEIDTQAEEEAFNNHVEITRELNFPYSLIWPTVGEIMIPYSMDKSVYFKTLDQYKYNPSVVIAAVEGDPVKACSDARVISVFSNEEIGNAIILELGDGYQATYGQIRDTQVSVGNYIDAGKVLGFVNKPTKYYSKEGTNVYFLLKKDDAPVDPTGFFQ